MKRCRGSDEWLWGRERCPPPVGGSAPGPSTQSKRGSRAARPWTRYDLRRLRPGEGVERPVAFGTSAELSILFQPVGFHWIGAPGSVRVPVVFSPAWRASARANGRVFRGGSTGLASVPSVGASGISGTADVAHARERNKNTISLYSMERRDECATVHSKSTVLWNWASALRL